MKKQVFLILLIGLSALLVWRELDTSRNRWVAYRYLDRLLFSVPALRGSKLMAFWEEKAGACAVSEGSASIFAGGEWQKQKGTTLPFGQLVRILSIPRQGDIKENYVGFAACRGGDGSEFYLQHQNRASVIQLDREPNGPIRIELFSTNDIRIVGKHIWVLLSSPLGDLELRSLADTELSVEMQADSEQNLSHQKIFVLSGQVHVERKALGASGPGTGVVELQAQKDGRLEWETQKDAVVEGRSATVLPSGIYWGGSQPGLLQGKPLKL